MMGLAEDSLLPPRYNGADHLVGDGVVVPAVRFLNDNLSTPLLAAQDAVALAAAQ
jgi:DNA (cytosine-5)-methyltransferase 1